MREVVHCYFNFGYISSLNEETPTKQHRKTQNSLLSHCWPKIFIDRRSGASLLTM